MRRLPRTGWSLVLLFIAAATAAAQEPADRPARPPSDRPAARPATPTPDRPAPPPADEPADRPAPPATDEPADRPAPPPVDQPADQPAANPAATNGRPAPKGPVIGSHQIDLYDAIQQVHQTLVSNPNSLPDWILLAELSQDVALNVRADEAAGYFRLARESYENALKLDPNNAGIQAAAKFLREQEANFEQFHNNRRQATRTYLDARRNELAGGQVVPTVRVYGAPIVAGQPAPVTTTTTSPYGPGYAYYQPLVTTQGQPYTYQQYTNSYYSPNIYNRPGVAPMTLRQYSTLLPAGPTSSAVRQLTPGINPNPVTPAPPPVPGAIP